MIFEISEWSIQRKTWNSPYICFCVFPSRMVKNGITPCYILMSIHNLWSRVQIRFRSTFQKLEFPILVQIRSEIVIWTQIGNSKFLKVDENRIWRRDHKRDPKLCDFRSKMTIWAQNWKFLRIRPTLATVEIHDWSSSSSTKLIS